MMCWWIGCQKIHTYTPGLVSDQHRMMVIMTDSQVKNLLSGNNSVTIVHVCVPQWVNGVPILLPSIEDTFEEIKSKTQDYLSLLELGVVLQEISDACPCEY